MRAGVQGFLGYKLTEAREARGISSRKALADLLQKAASTVSRWEDGESSPEHAALAELSRVLSVPTEFFLADRRARPSTVFFRSYAAAIKSDRAMQNARLRWLMDVTEVAEYYAHLPEIDLPNVLGNRSFKSLQDEDIEQIVADLRVHWGLGHRPIQDMLSFLEGLGVIVASEAMDTTKLDGLSAWDTASQRPFVLLANDKQSFARRQFDCAHELGHLVLHKNVSESELSANFPLIEEQANKFASSLILPSGQYPLDVYEISIWGLERLKLKWKVSIKAQIMRLRQLEIIDADLATRLFKIYSAKGYSKREPYDDAWPLQQPTLLNQTFNAIADGHNLTRAELLDDLSMSPHDAEGLANLPSGWFTSSPARVVTLRQPEVERTKSSGGGQILQFRPMRDQK